MTKQASTGTTVRPSSRDCIAVSRLIEQQFFGRCSIDPTRRQLLCVLEKSTSVRAGKPTAATPPPGRVPDAVDGVRLLQVEPDFHVALKTDHVSVAEAAAARHAVRELGALDRRTFPGGQAQFVGLPRARFSAR